MGTVLYHRNTTIDKMSLFSLLLIILIVSNRTSFGFIMNDPRTHDKTSFSSSITSLLQSSIQSDPSATISQSSLSTTEDQRRNELKQSLIRLCASFDRGFGSTPRIRKEVEELIRQLETINPMTSDAARGVDGKNHQEGGGEEDVPLKGAWRMIWTTALDVLNLGASPTLVPAGIYQVIDPPIATNIIDFTPRAQALLPVGFPSTVIRAKVQTRASIRDVNRVGLIFESVQLKPVEVFGFNADSLPPLKIDLPRVNIQDLPGVNAKTAPGFFDVTYLDRDMLIIKQNAPGGYFVSLKVSNYDP